MDWVTSGKEENWAWDDTFWFGLYELVSGDRFFDADRGSDFFVDLKERCNPGCNNPCVVVDRACASGGECRDSAGVYPDFDFFFNGGPGEDLYDRIRKIG